MSRAVYSLRSFNACQAAFLAVSHQTRNRGLFSTLSMLCTPADGRSSPCSPSLRYFQAVVDGACGVTSREQRAWCAAKNEWRFLQE